METLIVTTRAGKAYKFRPVPMKLMPSHTPEHWLRFQGQHIAGSELSESEMERIQSFMRKHKTEALAVENSKQAFTLAGGRLAYCDPEAVSRQ